MMKRASVAARLTCVLQAGLIWVVVTALAGSAQDMGAGPTSEIVVTRENLLSFSSGSGCKNVPYTGLVEGRAFIVAEAFVRMELWTQEGLPDSRAATSSVSSIHDIYLYQGNAYADWYPDRDPGRGLPRIGSHPGSLSQGARRHAGPGQGRQPLCRIPPAPPPLHIDSQRQPGCGILRDGDRLRTSLSRWAIRTVFSTFVKVERVNTTSSGGQDVAFRICRFRCLCPRSRDVSGHPQM